MGSLATTLIALIAGLAAGAGLAWLLLPQRRREAALQKELDDTRLALSRYREQVDSHFLRTADLVSQMNHAYREVHEQLAEGARQLCSEQGRRLAVARTFDLIDTGSTENADTDDDKVSAPLDYAPSHKGTLSEDFGLRRDAASEQTDATNVADDLLNPPRDYADGCNEQGCPPQEYAADNSKKPAGHN